MPTASASRRRLAGESTSGSRSIAMWPRVRTATLPPTNTIQTIRYSVSSSAQLIGARKT